MNYEEQLSRVGRTLTPNPIRKLTKLLGRGDVIALGAGAPSVETFPAQELAEIAAQVISERGPSTLQYGPTRGYGDLVEQVVAMMRGRGAAQADSSHIIVTTGSQQGLDLAARVLLDPGDVALVELPSYIGGTIALHNAQAELVGVRQDDGGIVIADLEEKILRLRKEGRRVKCVYAIPNFQNPSGISLAAERRRQLVEAADRHDLLIIEDDPYGEIYFSDEAARLKPLAALAPERVVYLSSFSKVLAPGLRTAWMCAPAPLAARIEIVKEGADLSSSMVDQAIVARAASSGLIERRLPGIREFYHTRCRAMLDALERHARPGWRWTRPAGGFFVLLELDGDADTEAMLPHIIENGVAYVPGRPFFVDGGGANTLRLAFSKESPEKITEGIERLCRALEVMRKA